MDPRRRSTRGPPSLYTRTIQMRKLALTVGEASSPSVFQVILLYSGNFATHSDMPPPCRLPEGKAASLLPPGTAMSLAVSCASSPGANRVYLRPSAVAGICNNSWRLGWCHSPRELVMTVQKASELSLCSFHFKLFGALIVIPTLSTWLDKLPHCRWHKEEVTSPDVVESLTL